MRLQSRALQKIQHSCPVELHPIQAMSAPPSHTAPATPGKEPETRPPESTHLAGLRAVATVEFAKGMVVLLGAIGVLTLLHHDLFNVAVNLLFTFHIDPARHVGQAVLNTADRMNDKQLWGIAGLGFAYASVRFVEGYGLWHARVWAEWFAILSGCLYLPWEIHALLHKADLLKWMLLVVNIAIVVYISYLRWTARQPLAQRELG